MPELCKVFETKWNDHIAEVSGEPPSPSSISSVLTEVEEKMEVALKKCSVFIGTKIVFWDMRKLWLEELHRHKVHRSGMDDILEKLNKYLTTISGTVLADVLSTVAGKQLDLPRRKKETL